MKSLRILVALYMYIDYIWKFENHALTKHCSGCVRACLVEGKRFNNNDNTDQKVHTKVGLR